MWPRKQLVELSQYAPTNIPELHRFSSAINIARDGFQQFPVFRALDALQQFTSGTN